MAHNFVIVAPGSRVEVVTAAATMPVTPEQTYCRRATRFFSTLQSSRAGQVGASRNSLRRRSRGFTHTSAFPGHGFVMFGAMYVTKQSEAELPTIANDENLPDIIRDAAKTTKLHAYPEAPPYWYRIFMRDSGPASIAVALPDAQNYCWDAGACRLRYVWRGGFVDPMPHWRTNGDGFAEVKGTIFYRSAPLAFRCVSATRKGAARHSFPRLPDRRRVAGVSLPG